jgi:hypothetical protein
MIPYETLLDAARLHFRTAAGSASYTKPARELARKLEREATEELDAFNSGEPQRELIELFRGPHRFTLVA